VPEPPAASEEAIKDAMETRGDWFVPVLISDLRQAADKGLGVIIHPQVSLIFLITVHSSG
jgi:hypothetical protein